MIEYFIFGIGMFSVFSMVVLSLYVGYSGGYPSDKYKSLKR